LSERATLLQFSRQRVPDPRPCSGKAPVTIRVVCTSKRHTTVNQMTGDGAVGSQRQAEVLLRLTNIRISNTRKKENCRCSKSLEIVFLLLF